MEKVGIKKGSTVLVHSGLNYLGQMEGPIPGQSLTSNPNEPTPWEKPPRHTTLNSALYSLFDMMTEEETYINIVTALGDVMPVTIMTQTILEDGFQKSMLSMAKISLRYL